LLHQAISIAGGRRAARHQRDGGQRAPSCDGDYISDARINNSGVVLGVAGDMVLLTRVCQLTSKARISKNDWHIACGSILNARQNRDATVCCSCGRRRDIISAY